MNDVPRCSFALAFVFVPGIIVEIIGSSFFHKVFLTSITLIVIGVNLYSAVHRQFRKLTKTKGGFANENSLLKLLYAGIMRATERWTHPVQNWNLTLSQMAIHFGDRVSKHVAL